GDEPLLAAAIAAGLVVATCSISLSVAYGAGMIGLLVVAGTAVEQESPVTRAFAYLVVTAVAILIGAVLRRMTQRAALLSDELAERQRQLETAVRVERERLADELHDFIAHELTIIAMHARVLEQSPDPEVQAESRDAIGTSARQALADIRRVLEVTHASRPIADDAVVERRRLVPTVTDIERELGRAGTRVETDGVFEVAAGMSQSMEVALAQFAREAATNIVKHAGSSDWVSLGFALERDVVTMRIMNPAPRAGASLALPTGGYGLARMRERATVLGGSFSAGATAEGWVVEVTLPAR
ncbi:MAG: histidine kinase, partial [Actinomycetota bacterium]|nr:histidine kinase [Actinomycetota bacterium]